MTTTGNFRALSETPHGRATYPSTARNSTAGCTAEDRRMAVTREGPNGLKERLQLLTLADPAEVGRSCTGTACEFAET
jgi:hypothetical protein